MGEDTGRWGARDSSCATTNRALQNRVLGKVVGCDMGDSEQPCFQRHAMGHRHDFCPFCFDTFCHLVLKNPFSLFALCNKTQKDSVIFEDPSNHLSQQSERIVESMHCSDGVVVPCSNYPSCWASHYEQPSSLRAGFRCQSGGDDRDIRLSDMGHARLLSKRISG